MTHEQKPESAEFRTRAAQECEIYEATVKAVCRGRSDYPPEVFRAYLERQIMEAEARGAAAQRQKDSDGAEPIAWVYEQRGQDGIWRRTVNLVYPIMGTNRRRLQSLFTHPANAPELIEEVVAAERKKIASKLDEVAKHLARPWGSSITEEGIAVKEACAARVEQEAAAIRRGG